MRYDIAMQRLRDALSRQYVVVADGGMGTLLQRRAVGSGPDSLPEQLLLEAPDAIRSIHDAYVAAGASILLTCSFAATRSRLDRLGLTTRMTEIHRRAARVAREAAGPGRVVVGDLGPLGEFLTPLGSLTSDEATTLYAERVEPLAESGCVDAILLETQYDLREIEAAVAAVRATCDLPVIVTLSFDRNGRTMMGIDPQEAAEALVALDVDVMGANCGRTMQETLDAVRGIREIAQGAIVWAKPNAGLPRTVEGVAVYDLSPKRFAVWARRFAEAGVRVFGGCCGTTPSHIEEAARALRSFSPD